mgnify:CR=1 FL=1
MTKDEVRVGYVGLGNLGVHLASSLLRAGHKIVVSDLSRDAAAPLVATSVPGGATQPLQTVSVDQQGVLRDPRLEELVRQIEKDVGYARTAQLPTNPEADDASFGGLPVDGDR